MQAVDDAGREFSSIWKTADAPDVKFQLAVVRLREIYCTSARVIEAVLGSILYGFINDYPFRPYF